MTVYLRLGPSPRLVGKEGGRGNPGPRGPLSSLPSDPWEKNPGEGNRHPPPPPRVRTRPHASLPPPGGVRLGMSGHLPRVLQGGRPDGRRCCGGGRCGRRGSGRTHRSGARTLAASRLTGHTHGPVTCYGGLTGGGKKNTWKIFPGDGVKKMDAKIVEVFPL